MTFVSEEKEFNKVHLEMEGSTSKRTKDFYNIVPNKFLCTLRNCRSHRLLFSTLCAGYLFKSHLVKRSSLVSVSMDAL